MHIHQGDSAGNDTGSTSHLVQDYYHQAGDSPKGRTGRAQRTRLEAWASHLCCITGFTRAAPSQRVARPRLTISSSSNIQNALLQELRKALRELCEPVRQSPGDIYAIVNEEDVSEIPATILVPRGNPYTVCVLNPCLVLPKEFPTSPPRGFFTTRIFHPDTAVPLGEIWVSTPKQDWEPDLCLLQILLTIKCLLTAPNPESALNEEGGRMLLKRPQDDDFHPVLELLLLAL